MSAIKTAVMVSILFLGGVLTVADASVTLNVDHGAENIYFTGSDSGLSDAGGVYYQTIWSSHTGSDYGPSYIITLPEYMLDMAPANNAEIGNTLQIGFSSWLELTIINGNADPGLITIFGKGPDYATGYNQLSTYYKDQLESFSGQINLLHGSGFSAVQINQIPAIPEPNSCILIWIALGVIALARGALFLT